MFNVCLLCFDIDVIFATPKLAKNSIFLNEKIFEAYFTTFFSISITFILRINLFPVENGRES